MEYACAVDNASLLFTIFFSDEPALVFGLIFVLPMTTLESLYIFGDVLKVFFIEEMRAERTATMHEFWRGFVKNSLAPLSVNAFVT